MNTIITLILLFGGIFFFILDTMFFETKASNVKWILMCIGAFIPLIGLAIFGILFFFSIAHYEKDSSSYKNKDYYESNIYVKDTKLNRWLFNDVEWSSIDKMKKIQNK